MYTIREAADRAGVSSEVLRAWERRYGVVSPRRTASGYRLYDAADIRRIRAMRTLVDDGWTPSAAAQSLRDVADVDLPQPASDAPSPSEGADDLVARFVDAAARIDAAETVAAIDEMGAKGSFEHVVDRYLFPALREIGDGWAAGRLSVAAEHAASGHAARWLAAAYEAAASNPARHRVLIGLPPEARHELGALAFATAARRAGLAVEYLGADLPVTDWVGAARGTDAAAAVIAVPTANDAAAARRVASALRGALPELPVFVGGRGAAGMSRVSVLEGPPGRAAAELRRRLATT